MNVKDIRVFIPSKNYELSQSFYQALGFKMDVASDDLSIFENNGCIFFLSNLYIEGLAENLMLQMSVVDINQAFGTIAKLTGFDIKFEPIKKERWGKVIYLWGPSGELWHITEFNNPLSNA